MKNIAKWANFSNNGAREIDLGSLDGADDVEYNGFVAISETLTVQGAFFYELGSDISKKTTLF